MSFKKSSYYYPCLLSVIALIVFGNTLLNGFVWDDVVYRVGTAVYKDFDLKKMLFSCGNGFEYRPLRDITRAIDYALWGDSPAGHHAGNILIYIGNLLALYFMTLHVSRFLDKGRRTDESLHRTIALFTALLFAVHPLRSEAVSFLGSRSALLAGVLVFCCCGFFLRYLQEDGARRGLFFGVALGCCLGAFLSYPAAVTFPLILFYFVLVNGSDRLRRNLCSLLPFFALSLVFYLVHIRVAHTRGSIVSELQSIGIAAKIARAVDIFFFYPQKFLLPLNLSPEYDIAFATTLANPVVILKLLAIAAVIALSFRYRNKLPEVFFAVSWYFAMFIPVSNYFATNPAVADRYAFLPTFAFSFLVVSLLFRFIPGNRSRFARGGLVLLLAILSLATFRQNMIWRDDRQLWEETVKRSPRLVKAYENLGVTYVNEGDYEKAIEIFKKMKDINLEGAVKYDYFEGVIFEKRGDLPNAARAYQQALAKNEEALATRFRLAGVNLQLGEFEQALENYGMVLLSRELDQGGLKAKALEQQEKIRKLVLPQLDALKSRVYSNQADSRERAQLAIQLDRIGYYDEALDNYLKLAESDTGNWQLFFNIANIYKKMNRLKEAATYYEKSLAANPGYPDTLNNLGVVYKGLQQYPRAVVFFEKAIAADPDYAFAPFNLATTYLLMGQKENALKYFRYTREHFPELEIKVRDYLKVLEQK